MCLNDREKRGFSDGENLADLIDQYRDLTLERTLQNDQLGVQTGAPLGKLKQPVETQDRYCCPSQIEETLQRGRQPGWARKFCHRSDPSDVFQRYSGLFADQLKHE